MKNLKKFQPLISVFLGLFLGLIVSTIAGENPLHVLKILANGAVGSHYDLGMTLFYATPLMLTGLSVAFAFHAGLFNIGAEGQLVMGALCCAAVGAYFQNLSSFIAIPLGIASAFFGGAIWGAIPGWLRAKRGSHEVINTIMLNFIAAGLASYLTLYHMRNTESQNPESLPIGAGFMISRFSFLDDSPIGMALPLALLMAFLVYLFLWKTPYGFEIRALGQNEKAAKMAGVNPERAQILSMAVAGGLAGLVGVVEVMGNAGKLRLDFSPGYGFIGIAVALLGRNRPLGVVASALLFGALHKGTSDLDIETEHVTKDLSLILQALIILSVSSVGLWDFMNRRKSVAK